MSLYGLRNYTLWRVAFANYGTGIAGGGPALQTLGQQ